MDADGEGGKGFLTVSARHWGPIRSCVPEHSSDTVGKHPRPQLAGTTVSVPVWVNNSRRPQGPPWSGGDAAFDDFPQRADQLRPLLGQQVRQRLADALHEAVQGRRVPPVPPVANVVTPALPPRHDGNPLRALDEHVQHLKG